MEQSKTAQRCKWTGILIDKKVVIHLRLLIMQLVKRGPFAYK